MLENIFEDTSYIRLKLTSAEYAVNIGKNRFLQYWLKRRVKTGRGSIQVDAGESFFNAKLPTAIICMSTNANIIESWTIGQNLPAVSYFGAFTFMNCIIQNRSISTNKQFSRISILMDKIKWLYIVRLLSQQKEKNLRLKLKIFYFVNSYKTETSTGQSRI